MSVILKSIKDGWLLLSEKGSRFRMILAGTLLAFAFMTPMMLGVYLPSATLPLALRSLDIINEYLRAQNSHELVLLLSEAELELLAEGLVYDLTVLFGALMTLPAYAYFFTYSWQTYSRTRYGFVDRERPKKGSYNYFRSLGAGLLMLLRPLVCFVMLQAGYLLARVISEATEYEGMAIPMIALLVPFWAVALALSVLLLWLTNSRFLVPYYYGRGMTVREATRLSKRKCAHHPFYCDLFSIIFGVMAVLSLLSVGVLFVLMVLPLMMFTYFSLAEHMDGKKLLED